MGAYLKGIPETAIQLAVSTGDILYTCPLGVHARVDDLSFKNTTTTDRTVTLYLVRAGGAIGVTFEIWNAVSIPKTATAPKGVICYEIIGKILNPGDFIQAFASAATAITPMGSVVEFN